MERARSWTFTVNNSTPSDEARIREMKVKYLVFGREKAPSTGTPHLQGYVTWTATKTMSATKSAIGPAAHVEIARGTAEQNRTYCIKEGNYEEYGTLPKSVSGNGAREKERWQSAWDAAKLGDLEGVPADIRVRCYNTLKTIAKDHMVVPPDADGVTGIWLYGAAGAGKSRAARERYPESYLKLVNKWWDGYQGQSTVIIDDVDKSHSVLGHHFKIWADRYAFNAETKGGMLCIRPKAIIITSQYTPEDIWDDCETRDAINRRFTVERIGDAAAAAVPWFEIPVKRT